MNNTFVFAAPRPMINALKNMPGFLEGISSAGDFACFYDSPNGAECIKDAIIIMYAPNDQSQVDYIKFIRNNFHNNNLLVIYEGSDAFHKGTAGIKLVSGYKATIAEKDRDFSIFFPIQRVVQGVQTKVLFKPRKKLIILETFRHAIYQDLRKSDYATFIRGEMCLGNDVSMFFLNDASDFVADKDTYFVVFQTPNACATNPSVLAFEMEHRDDHNVLCTPSMKWTEIGQKLKERCPEIFM